MVKECEVILRNELVMVVAYENKKIQFPADGKHDKIVFVKFEKGKYSIADKKSYDLSLKSNEKTVKENQKKIIKENIKEENSEL